MTATDPEPNGPKLSDCCGVSVNTDYLICPECLEHCGAVDEEETPEREPRDYDDEPTWEQKCGDDLLMGKEPKP